jgi:hypothetical protein
MTGPWYVNLKLTVSEMRVLSAPPCPNPLAQSGCHLRLQLPMQQATKNSSGSPQLFFGGHGSSSSCQHLPPVGTANQKGDQKKDYHIHQQIFCSQNTLFVRLKGITPNHDYNLMQIMLSKLIQCFNTQYCLNSKVAQVGGNWTWRFKHLDIEGYTKNWR